MTKYFTLFFLIIHYSVSGQTGGTTSFQNLNTNYTARHLGLAGDFISVFDADHTLAFSNAALLNEQSSNRGSLSQTLLAGGINTGQLSYSKTFNKLSTMGHFRYIAYGKMSRRDETGADLGTFSPGDFILGGTVSKAINERMQIGGTLNILYSQLDNYIAFGSSIDLGGIYHNDDKNLVISGVVKNLGVQFKGYTATRYPLPLEVQLGVSKKLAHAPFRFSLIAQQLQRWDLSYVDPTAKPTIDALSGDTIPVKTDNFAVKLFRHAVIQTEILAGQKVHLRAGFDFNRRKELALSNRPGLAGFSFGLGLYFKRFSIDYGWMIYSSAGGQHGVSLSLPIKGKKQ